MSKKRAYNQGVELGLKVAQKVMEQEIEAMDYLQSRLDLIAEGHEEMKSAVNSIIEDANENAIINLFGVCNEHEPSELKDHEKKILLNILTTLSAVGINEEQRKYQNNLRHHLDVQKYNPVQDYDFRMLEAIESVRSIKIIAKAVRIFLYLQDGNMDGVYRHEDDLFSHFELRSFDEIDAMIELFTYLFGIDGIVEMYGDFGDSDEFKQKDSIYLKVEEKPYIDINYECAQIYFKNYTLYDKGLQHIESSSYVIYSEKDAIMRLHKSTGKAGILLEHVENATEFIKDGKIATFADMGYYVLENDLYFIDLDSLASGLIFHIDEEYYGDGDIKEVARLCIYKSQKLIYRNGSTYIVDLELGMQSKHKFSLGSESCNFSMYGDYLYYVDMDTDTIDVKVRYVVKRYGILNEQTTNVSKPFGEHSLSDSIKAVYELQSMGIAGKNFYCIFAYQGVTSKENVGFDCVYVSIDEEKIAEVRKFYIWNARVYQIEQCGENLIYVNADKGFSLISHNFVSDKKKVLEKKFGRVEKSVWWERSLLGKSSFQKPDKYMRLGRWIFIFKRKEMTSEIIFV